MSGKSITINVNNIYNMMKRGQLKVPSYQRNFVWSIEQQSLLIDSILKGYYIGQILLAKSEDESCFDIIDGQQRIKTIYYFVENGFKIKKEDQALGDIAQQDFLKRPIQFHIIDELLGIEEIIEVFKTINTTGEPLTNQELRRVRNGGFFSKTVSEITAELFPNKENLMISEELDKCFEFSFWHRLGILTKQQLLKMEDEVLVARIILSVLFGKYIESNDNLLDEAYDEQSLCFSKISTELTKTTTSSLLEKIKFIFTVLEETTFSVNCFSKDGFYIVFLALYDVLINEQKEINSSDLLLEVFDNINSLISNNQIKNSQYGSLQKYAKYLIQQNCFESDASRKISVLKWILNDSKVETAKYEFKQGFLRLSDDRKKDNDLKNRILETICGMANASFMEPAYLLIGIADKESDALRIKALDGVTPLKFADHYIVGIEREAKIMNISVDKYFAQIKDMIDNSQLSQALKLSVLANMDVIKYHGFSVVSIVVPPQKELSYLESCIFVRKGSSTTAVVDAREIIALYNNYSHCL